MWWTGFKVVLETTSSCVRMRSVSSLELDMAEVLECCLEHDCVPIRKYPIYQRLHQYSVSTCMHVTCTMTLCHLTRTILSLEVTTSNKVIISLHMYTLHTYHGRLLSACIEDLFLFSSAWAWTTIYFAPEAIIRDYGSCLYVSIWVSNPPQPKLLSFWSISRRSDTLVILPTQLLVRLRHVFPRLYGLCASVLVTVEFTEFLNIHLTH